jgi:O-antigen ligase/tetratricopeptide (TPR) repeat protein
MAAMPKNKPRKTQSTPVPNKQMHAGIFRKRELPEYLSNAILGISCFVLFLPVVVSYDFYSPYIFFKSILFRIAVQFMLLLYVVLALISSHYKPRLNRISWALLCWFGIMLFCSLPGISTNAWKSWWGDFNRMDGMFTQLHLLAYFFVLVQTFKKENDWLWLFTASLVSSVFMGVSGLIQKLGIDLIYRFVGQSERIDGATGNADFFASYMMLNFCIGLYFLARKDKKDLYPIVAKIWLVLLIALDIGLVLWHLASGGQALSRVQDYFAIALFIVVLHCAILLWYIMRRNIGAGAAFMSILCFYDLFWIFQSQTRSAAVGLAAGLAFAALLYVCKGKNMRIRWAGAFLILLFAILPITLYRNRESGWVRSNPMLNRLTSTTFAERRFIAWKAGVLGIMDRPVWGWGLEHYRKSFDLHAPVQLFRGEAAENWDDRAHNIILDVGTTTGVLGLTAFLIFYVLVFAFLLRSWFRNPEKTECLLIAGLLTAYLVQDLFIFDTANTDGIMFLILAYIAYLSGSTTRVTEEHPSRLKPARSLSLRDYSILALAAGSLICAFHYLVQQPLNSNFLLLKGISVGRAAVSQPEKARYIASESIIDNFQRAEQVRTTGCYQVREEFANCASELASAAGVSLQVKTQVARKALTLLEKSTVEDPSDCRHYMYAASLTNSVLETIKQSDPPAAISLAKKNLELLRRAENLGPNRPRIFVEYAQSLLFLGRTDEAIPELQKAIALDPGNTRMRVDLAAICVSAGRYTEAENEWRKIDRSVLQPADYERLIGLYASKKQLAPVIALYKDQLRATPVSPAILVRMAVIYREMGNMDAARETALNAAKISPQAAAQLQDFLKTLEGNTPK